MIEPLKYDSCSQLPLASFLGRAEVDSAIIQLPENNPFLNMRAAGGIRRAAVLF
jgi:hypothetical protein